MNNSFLYQLEDLFPFSWELNHRKNSQDSTWCDGNQVFIGGNNDYNTTTVKTRNQFLVSILVSILVKFGSFPQIGVKIKHV